MTDKEIKINHRMTQCYIEIARSVFTKIHFPDDMPQELEKDDFNQNVNILFSLISMTVIYSFLAIEAFINYQLYQIWEKRNTKDVTGQKFKAKFGDVKRFEDLIKQYDKQKDFRELKDRINTVCDLLGYRRLEECNPKLWQKFNNLLKKTRNFLVHPYPDQRIFQEMHELMMEKTKSGEYLSVACEIISYLYQSSRINPPDWLESNYLFEFRGVNYLARRKKGGDES